MKEVHNTGNLNVIREMKGNIHQNIYLQQNPDIIIDRIKDIEKKLDMIIEVMEINEKHK
jgi:tRNA A37 threonylcarbamoyladenosine dehydratase